MFSVTTGLSHLREYNFKHISQNSINYFYSCRKDEFETSSHYLLHFSNYSEMRLAVLTTIIAAIGPSFHFTTMWLEIY